MPDNGKRQTRKPRRPSTAPSALPVLVPQPHGGALLSGGIPGHPGYGGRPVGLVRAAFREAIADRLPVLTAIADGEPVQRMSVPLAAILGHVTCPECDSHLEANDAASLAMVSLEGFGSASPGDRIRAIEAMGRHSDLSGTPQPLAPASEEVLVLLKRTRCMIEADYPDIAAELLDKMNQIWNAEYEAEVARYDQDRRDENCSPTAP